MALSRRGSKREPLSIWPGFVDAFTTLLLLLMFVLTIFLVVQFALRDTITTQSGTIAQQGNQLDTLNEQLASLAAALGMQQDENARVTGALDAASRTLAGEKAKGELQSTLIASLNTTVAENAARISSFEAQVASLLAEQTKAQGEVSDLQAAQTRLMTDQQALNLALAKARSEIDAKAEAARLAAAQREAIEAMLAETKAQVAAKDASLADALAALEQATGERTALVAKVNGLQADISQAEQARLAEQAAAAALQARLAGVQADLSAEEKARLVEAAAAEALRERLKTADTELTAMTLALEEQRQKAEDTLTLLAGADAARKDLDLKLAAALLAEQTARTQAADLQETQTQDRAEIEKRLAAALAAKLAAEGQASAQMTAAEQKATLLAAANTALSEKQAQTAEAERKVALLNQQMVELRSQLGILQAVLDATASRDTEANVQIEALGSQLNSALATVAAEQRRRAELEEAERKRLQAEAVSLEGYRSEFFGKLRTLLAGREGVRVVGDRFVFSSEVLFQPGAADLAPEGQAQIASVVLSLKDVIAQIPPEIDWMIRVDGHTDNVPLSGAGAFANNWELSQARALSVVLYMVNILGFPPEHVAATGFGEFRPVATGDSPQARAQNRRIELKLTER